MRFQISCKKNSLLLLGVLLIAGCNNAADNKKSAGPAPVLISTTQVKVIDLDIVEQTVGTLEGIIDPKIGAEVAGRVVKVMAGAGMRIKRGQVLAIIDSQDAALQQRVDQSEVSRFSALLANQNRAVERSRKLVESKFISQTALDDATAQRDALAQQLDGAKARLALTSRNLGKSQVVAPLDAQIEHPIVAVGDFVKIGDPLFLVIATQKLHAHLPFPEGVASRMKVGLPARLTSPSSPGQLIISQIDEIKPLVGVNSRAVDAIVRIDNSNGMWKPGASVNGAVTVARRPSTLVIPEQSVALRPAGKVVYVINGDKAEQRIVETGVKQQEGIEIISGLKAGETIALDGAGFLTDKAAVTLAGKKTK